MSILAKDFGDIVEQKNAEIFALTEELDMQRSRSSMLEGENAGLKQLCTQYQQERDILERALKKLHEERAIQKAASWNDQIQEYEGEAK